MSAGSATVSASSSISAGTTSKEGTSCLSNSCLRGEALARITRGTSAVFQRHSVYSRVMRTLFAIAVAAFLLGGCRKPVAPETASRADAPSAPPGAAQGGPSAIGPNVGGITPVTGTDSVEGVGSGGVGNAAKDKARGVAGQVSSSATPAEGGETTG